MALNNAAADAALETWISGLNPVPTADQKQAIRDSMQPLVRAIYAGIVASAVVSPAGTIPMNVGGTSVGGFGKIT